MISDEKLAEYKRLASGTVMDFNAAGLLPTQIQSLIAMLVAEIETLRSSPPPPPESAVALHAAGDFDEDDDEDEDDEVEDADEEGERRVSAPARKRATSRASARKVAPRKRR